VISLVHECFEKMKFASPYREHVTAPWPGTSSTTAFAGLTSEGLEFGAWDQGQPNGIGQGARLDHDGQDTAGFVWCAIGEFLDAEQVEQNYPVIAIFRSRVGRDAAGMGKFRGGRSMNGLYQVRGTPMIYSVVMGGFSGRPMAPGLFGGYPSRPVAGALIRDNNLEQLIEEGRSPTDLYEAVERLEGDWQFVHSNWGLEELYNGDCWIGLAPSGPGYGDVLERDPELVMKDLREDAISHRTAREIYKVVYREDNLVPDLEATELFRKEEREHRIGRGKRYAEWEPGWRKKRPPERLLKELYGFWPHGTPGRMMFSPAARSEHYVDEDVREARRPPVNGIPRPA
jgi:acetone carboxylase, alpha subunit